MKRTVVYTWTAEVDHPGYTFPGRVNGRAAGSADTYSADDAYRDALQWLEAQGLQHVIGSFLFTGQRYF